MSFLRRIILWDHERGTWQYDIFCLLIIAFIFLTPKAWFEKREKVATQTSKLAVKSKDLSTGRARLEKRITQLSADAQLLTLHQRLDNTGEFFYKVGIR